MTWWGSFWILWGEAKFTRAVTNCAYMFLFLYCRQIAVINFNWKKVASFGIQLSAFYPSYVGLNFYTHVTNNSQSACTVSSLSLLIKGKDLLISKSSSNIIKLIPVKIKLDRIQTPLEKPYMQTSKSYVNHYLNLKKKMFT